MNIQIRYEKHFDPNLSGLVERTSNLKRSRIAYLSSFLREVCFLKKKVTHSNFQIVLFVAAVQMAQ